MIIKSKTSFISSSILLSLRHRLTLELNWVSNKFKEWLNIRPSFRFSSNKPKYICYNNLLVLESKNGNHMLDNIMPPKIIMHYIERCRRTSAVDTTCKCLCLDKRQMLQSYYWQNVWTEYPFLVQSTGDRLMTHVAILEGGWGS